MRLLLDLVGAGIAVGAFDTDVSEEDGRGGRLLTTGVGAAEHGRRVRRAGVSRSAEGAAKVKVAPGSEPEDDFDYQYCNNQGRN